MDRPPSRRRFLSASATLATAALSGCGSPGSTVDTSDTSESPETVVAPPQNATLPDPSEYEAVYQAVSDSVASVRTYDGSGTGGQGSAFVYDGKRLVTNEHVVAGASAVFARFTSTGWRNVTVGATDVYSDLAVLEIENKPDAAPPIPLVKRDPPVGTPVVAIGNPFGFSGSVSAGILSGEDRTLPAANGFSIPDAIQTDAAVNPGNSGGPIVDLDGKLVGVVNSGGGDNLGFGISAALTSRVVPALIESGSYEHSYVGVSLTPVSPPIATANDLVPASGVYIDTVVEDTPADGVLQGSTGTAVVNGIETPVGGDVIVALDDQPIPTRQALSSFLALETRPGTTVSLGIIRDGRRTEVALELGTRPDPSN
jgi:S1-C subfamily serine protease